jgi:hypothetical protein
VDFTNCLVCQQKKDGSLSHRTVLEEITSTYDDLGMRCERDAFDTLFDHAPDKLQVVKKVWLSYTHYSFKVITLKWAVGKINLTECCKCILTSKMLLNILPQSDVSSFLQQTVQLLKTFTVKCTKL